MYSKAAGAALGCKNCKQSVNAAARQAGESQFVVMLNNTWLPAAL